MPNMQHTHGMFTKRIENPSDELIEQMLGALGQKSELTLGGVVFEVTVTGVHFEPGEFSGDVPRIEIMGHTTPRKA